jgi:NADH-quinone oxidoreductase subunit J
VTLMAVIFWGAAAAAVAATGLAVTRRNAIHALLYLVVSFLAAAVMFFTLGAPLAAALEVIIYAGAVVVLFVFVVMMFNLQADRPRRGPWTSLRTWAGPALLSAALLAELLIVLAAGGRHGLAARPVAPRAVGLSLFSAYVLGVELAAMLLLAAIVGAYHLGSRKPVFHHRFFEEPPQ